MFNYDELWQAFKLFENSCVVLAVHGIYININPVNKTAYFLIWSHIMKNLSLIILFLFSQMSLSATFCVSTSNELQNALTTAQGNGSSDYIYIKEGSYNVPNTGFRYWSNENYDLEISGGWSSFFDNPCGLQSNDPYNTTLDGGGSNDGENLPILYIFGFTGITTADVTIKNILFINGYSGISGGISITMNFSEYSGHVKIENNAFIGNESPNYNSAVHAEGGKITFKNNLVAGNHVNISNSVLLESFNATGIYVTNNTIIGNTSNSVSGFSLGGLSLKVTGTSQALIANNIFYNNDIRDLELEGDGYKYSYNNNIVGFQTGTADEEYMNFSSVPVFESGILNYTPALSSDLINSGFQPIFLLPPVPFVYNWSLSSTDLAGNIRVQDNTVDVGAYEATAETPIFANGFE